MNASANWTVEDETAVEIARWGVAGLVGWVWLGCVVVPGLLFHVGVLTVGLKMGQWPPVLVQLMLLESLALMLVAPLELMAQGSPPPAPWMLPADWCPAYLGIHALLEAALGLTLVVISATPPPGNARLPLALLWVLSTSLAVPPLLVGDVVCPSPSAPLCTLDRAPLLLLHALVGALPPVLLSGSLVFQALSPLPPRMPMALAASHLLMSLPRSLSALVFAAGAGRGTFATPPLADTWGVPGISLSLSCLHYLGLSLRPLLVWFTATPELRTSLFQKAADEEPQKEECENPDQPPD